MAARDFLVQNADILCYKSLTDVEKLKILGEGLYQTVSTALAFAGAATSVFVLKGIFGEDIVGRFEQLVGIIGGTVIGHVAGCIVFSISGIVALGFVMAFVLGALAGGVICVMTAYRKEILSAIQCLWTAAMEKIKGFASAVVEEVQNALAEVVRVMTRAYTTICDTLDRVGKAFARMSKEEKAKVLTGVKTAADEYTDSIKKANDEFTKKIDSILARFDKKEVAKVVTKTVQFTQEKNSEVIDKKMESLMSDETSLQVTEEPKSMTKRQLIEK